MISRTIETEAKKAHKYGAISPGELHGRGLVTLACEIKTYENLFCGLLGQVCENLHQRKFPATVLFLLKIDTKIVILFSYAQLSAANV